MLAMIKINLLPQRRPKRQAEPGQGQVLIGIGALAAVAFVVFFAVHLPVARQRDEFRTKASELKAQNDKKRNSEAIRNLPKLNAAVAENEERSQAIARLIGTIVVPDNVLHELGELLTPGKLPTMSKEMAERVSDTNKGDPNRRFSLDWDPKHVWLTSISFKEDAFKLEGGAQSEGDIPQLAKRMQASVYFAEITSPSSQRIDDKTTAVSYHKFTITGKVVY